MQVLPCLSHTDNTLNPGDQLALVFSLLSAKLLQSKRELAHRFDGLSQGAPFASTDVQERSLLDPLLFGSGSDATTEAFGTPDCNHMHYKAFLILVHDCVRIPCPGLTNRIVPKISVGYITSRIE